MMRRHTAILTPLLALTVSASWAQEPSAAAADWLPEDVPADAPVMKFDRSCATDPREFHDAPASAVKQPAMLSAAQTYRIQSVPASFKKEHPQLRKGSPSFTTLLALLVNEDGKIVEARVRRSSGFEELDRIALGRLAAGA